VKEALGAWNRDGRPIVGDILNNGHSQFDNWMIGKAVAFKTGETLTWEQWRTTEARLWASEMFSNVGVEVEPTPQADRYTVVLRTIPKTNAADQYVVSALEGLLFLNPTVRWWNIRNSAVSLSAGYRFAENRLRGELGVRVPLPLPGLVFFEGQGIYRSERWDIARPAIDNGADTRFRYQSTGFRMLLKHIPHYRVELGAGFEYRNRTTGGSVDALRFDSRNTGKLLFEASVLPADGRYRSRVHAETFLARRGVLGTMNYNGGTLEWNNRYLVNETRAMNLELTAKGGRTSGDVPIDDYFVLGLDQSPTNLLRGHETFGSGGHYGNAPMGTSFALVNATLDHRIRRFPFFNVLNVPFTDLKWQVFVDGGKTWDRAHVFNAGKLLIDVGAGFKLETPTRAINLTYGRSLRDGTGTFAAYVQKRW
jgi:outer membrane protein assembly factor BamA